MAHKGKRGPGEGFVSQREEQNERLHTCNSFGSEDSQEARLDRVPRARMRMYKNGAHRYVRRDSVKLLRP